MTQLILTTTAGAMASIYAVAKMANMRKGVQMWESSCHGCCTLIPPGASECPNCGVARIVAH